MRKTTIPSAIALLVAACGSGEANNTTASGSAQADPGRTAFSQCALCHNVKEGEPNGIGPNLYGIYGAKSGAIDGFAYSRALREADLTWDDATLDAFIENPQSLVRGNRMAYAGERNADTRAAIIDYLKRNGPSE